MQLVLPEIESLGASLVAVSPQLPDNSLSTAEKNNLTFEVLSDVGSHVARNYGLIFTLPEALRPIYQGFGIDLPAANGDESFELPLPATYVVDTSCTIRFAFVDVDYSKRIEPSEVIDALKGMKTGG